MTRLAVGDRVRDMVGREGSVVAVDDTPGALPRVLVRFADLVEEWLPTGYLERFPAALELGGYRR